MNKITWLLLSFSILSEGLADIAVKEYQLYGGNIRYIITGIVYSLTWIFWVWAMKNKNLGLAIGGSIFWIVSSLLAVIIGVLIYKEPLNIYQGIGILLGMIGVGLIIK